MTCTVDSAPLSAYPCSSRPSCARSGRFRGNAAVIGSVVAHRRMTRVERGKMMSTNSTGACTCERGRDRTSAGESGKMVRTLADAITRATDLGVGRRTDGCPSHRRAAFARAFVCGFSDAAERSSKNARVGDADRGRMEESSVLARLCSGDDGVEGKLSGEACSACVSETNMDASFERGEEEKEVEAEAEAGEGMVRVSAGVSRTQGVAGMGVSSEGRWRELERRRPREPRVSGGRTLVDDARCLLGGGTGREQEAAADMARKQRRRGRGLVARPGSNTARRLLLVTTSLIFFCSPPVSDITPSPNPDGPPTASPGEQHAYVRALAYAASAFRIRPASSPTLAPDAATAPRSLVFVRRNASQRSHLGSETGSCSHLRPSCVLTYAHPQ